MLMMRSSATVTISHLPTTDSSSGRFHAALSPSLFRDAAGALEARTRQRNHVDGADKGCSPIVACARGDGQWGKAADAQEPASKQVLVAVGASQETEKGPAT